MEPRSTSPTLDPADLREARRHVKRLRDFLQLCVTAGLVIALTAAVNVMTSPHRLWFLWVVLGFSSALGVAALETFGRDLWLGREWQERKLREFLARQSR
jgi:hypothetical protein